MVLLETILIVRATVLEQLTCLLLFFHSLDSLSSRVLFFVVKDEHDYEFYMFARQLTLLSFAYGYLKLKDKFPLQLKNANRSTMDTTETVIVYSLLSFALFTAFISSLSYVFYK